MNADDPPVVSQRGGNAGLSLAGPATAPEVSGSDRLPRQALPAGQGARGVGQILDAVVRDAWAASAASVTLHLNFTESSTRLAAGLETQFLSIAERALFLVTQRLGVQNVWVWLSLDAPTAALRIEDDGVVSDPEGEQASAVLVMQRTAALMGASFRSTTGRLRGNEISLTLRGREPEQTILLVEPHELTRQGLRLAFAADDNFTVIAETDTVGSALRLAAQLRPTVIVMEAVLPDGSGTAAVRKLRAEDPKLGIVILTTFDDDENLFQALDAQASAFVAKTASTAEILAAIRHAAATPHAFSATRLPDALARRLARQDEELTEREHRVLELLSEGLTVTAIATTLFLSESTTKGYAARVYAKLGATNRSQALVIAMRRGLLAAGPGVAGAR